jgi:tryptophan halogenase
MSPSTKEASVKADRGASPDASRRIKRIAIVGGGTAGWMAASILARALHGSGCAICVVESPEIGTVGVGEATIPPIIDLLKFLGIDEADFIRHTQATYKLGIKFIDWREVGESYWHPFGTFGEPINRRPFFHAWHKARAEGLAPKFNDYSLCAALGDAGRFRRPDARATGAVAGLRYALHFDAGLVAAYLRAYSERMGVARLERTVAGVTQRDDGFLEDLVFTDNARLKADLYLDCSGFRGLLIEQTLKTGYDSWTQWLPCDRAIAMPTDNNGPRPPYTQAKALKAGWRWRIPLQHRAGNGYVYSSAHLTDEAAERELREDVNQAALADPRLLKFVTGRRKALWRKNCVSIGLASGFLEPLESTSIHLAMSGVYNLLDHFPDLDFDHSNIASYNAMLIGEMERIRDFIILHYCTTQRRDTNFWKDCAQMSLPETLVDRVELYQRTGRAPVKAGELFTDVSWFYIFEGMGIRPDSFDPLMDVVPTDRLREAFAALAASTKAGLSSAPLHDQAFAPSSPVRAA